MNPSTSYFDQFVLSADPVTLIRMLLQKASTHVADARKCLASGEIQNRGTAILKAYEIILELQATLQDEHAPELCDRLRALYNYMQERLITANVQQLDAPLAEVHGLLATLIEAWTPTVQESTPISHAAMRDHTFAPQVYAA